MTNRPQDRRPDGRRDTVAAYALPVGVLMLVAWAASILTIETPGWMHLLLTLGVFFVIWGIVRRGTPPDGPRR